MVERMLWEHIPSERVMRGIVYRLNNDRLANAVLVTACVWFSGIFTAGVRANQAMSAMNADRR
jgi:hypothetical protein